MNILWIEDFGGNSSPVDDTLESMFGSLLSFDRWDGDSISLSDNPDALEHFTRENSPLHIIFLCRHYFDYVDFKKNHDVIKQVDTIIIDIRLDNNIDYRLNIPSKQEKYKFHENAGFFIFNDLAQIGFPVDRMCFMTGETGSLRKFEDQCEEIYLPTVAAFEKGKEYSKLQDWIHQQNSEYITLRRGIIAGYQFAKKLDPKNFYFNEYVDKKGNIDPDDISNYLDVLENFLPLREPEKPEKKAIFYKLFVRTLSHEWEAADAIDRAIKRRGNTKKEASLAWIMLNTRNWITHNSELFSSLDEKMVAYLFMINLRVMFSFDGTVQLYEKILLNLFSKDTLPEKELTEKLNDRSMISIAYNDLKNLVVTENERGLYIKDALYFNQLANNIQECNLCALRSDKKLFNKLLYQHFWLTTSNSYIDKNTSELKFWRFNYTETPYIKELARHIYRHSFPEV